LRGGRYVDKFLEKTIACIDMHLEYRQLEKKRSRGKKAVYLKLLVQKRAKPPYA